MLAAIGKAMTAPAGPVSPIVAPVQRLYLLAAVRTEKMTPAAVPCQADDLPDRPKHQTVEADLHSPPDFLPIQGGHG